MYGYHFLGIHLGAGDAGFCYDLERYEKESRTKVQMSEDILRLCGKRKRTSLSMMVCRMPPVPILFTSAGSLTFSVKIINTYLIRNLKQRLKHRKIDSKKLSLEKSFSLAYLVFFLISHLMRQFVLDSLMKFAD